MTISQIMSGTPNVQIVVSGADLKEFGQFLINEASKVTEKDESYLSVDEASSILKVNRSTLYRWQLSGYLTPSKVGSRSVYKMSDVKNLLNNTSNGRIKVGQ